MTIETIFIFGISIALLYIKPGPNQAMKITRALNDGFLPSFYFTCGATSIVILYFTLASIGFGIAEFVVDAIGFYFKLIGGGYLIYLGYKGFDSIEKGVWKGRLDQTHKRSFTENYIIGVVMTLANPITIFYFIGIVPVFIQFDGMTITDILAGIVTIVVVGGLADVILITLVTQAKEALSDTAFVKKINIFTSVGFILIGSFLLFSAFFLGEYSFDMG
jgi:threonine/homoserine/homoserine lactone efflux protein